MTKQLFPDFFDLGFPICNSAPGVCGANWEFAGATDASLAVNVWPTANKALFTPISIPKTIVIVGLAWFNSGTISGNIDVGIYTIAGAKLVSAGSTVHAGASVIQTAAVAATALAPGTYFLAMAMDNATAGINTHGFTAQLGRTYGLQEMATAFPLPATATLVNNISGISPIMSIMRQATL